MNSTRDTSSSILPPIVQRLFPYYVLIVAVWVVYSNTYDNDFLYDDHFLILQNRFLQSWGSLGDIFTHYVNAGADRDGHFYRPMQNIVYLITYQIAGPSKFAFHFLNILLHAANACLVFALGRKLNFNFWAVFCGALIWALHPLHTEAITYMSGTADGLYVFFCLSALLVLLPDFGLRKFLIAVPLFILGILSKETAVILPLLAMSCLYLLSSQRLKPKTYVKTWPLWALALGYVVIRLFIMPFAGNELLNVDEVSQKYAASILIRIYTFLTTIPAYLELLFWPHDLHMDRDLHAFLEPWYWEVFIGLFILIAAGAQIIWSKGKRGLGAAWGILWFASAQLPHTGVLVPVNALFLEHWMYLPSVGLALGLSETIARNIHKEVLQRTGVITALVIALALGCKTHEQNAVWHDPFSFYHNILDRGETTVRAKNNLGIAYMDAGQYDKAMEQFRSALKDTDLTPETHQNIASLLSKLPDGQSHLREATEELHKALKIDPDFLPAYVSLAEIYRYLGDREKEAHYTRKAEMLRKKFRK